MGAVLDAVRIPLTEAAQTAADGRSPLLHGLSDGEDFELLFTVAPEDGQKLLREWQDDTTVTKIGEICESPGCHLRDPDGRLEPLAALGWTHSLGHSQ